MRPPKLLAILLSVAAARAAAVGGQAQELPGLEARVWLDRGEEPVLQRGSQVRVYYRTSEDAYAAIFRIDTDGVISMVFPQHPGAIEVVRGGRDYRLLFPDAPLWSVGDEPGVGYFFMVASPEPLDFSAFAYDERLGWDLGPVSGVVYEDPYVAIDDYVAELVPGWEVVPYALDFLTYHVGNTYSYPRFLCYDCHTARPYASWNPYDVACTSFRVVIWDDPYFYPTYRYSGTSVVVARPARSLPRYEFVTRAPYDIGVRPLVYSRPAPERRVAQFKEAPEVPAASRVPVRRSPTPSASRGAQQAPGRQAQQGPDDGAARPTLQPRPSASPSTRTPPGAAASRSPEARATATRGEQPAAPAPDPSAEPDRRAGPERPPTRPSSARTAPARPTSSTTRPSESGRGPATGQDAPPRARAVAPSRPSAGSAPSRPPTTRSAPSRPSARPATPSAGRPAAARPSATPRAPAARPTVRPRGTARGN